MRVLAFLVPLALAACGDPPPRPPVPGPEAQKAVDAATVAYADCIEKGTAAAPIGSSTPGNVVSGVVAACRPQRDALADKIKVLQRLGHPNQSEAQVEVIADASIKLFEPDLREKAVVALIRRELDAKDSK
jgi:hypothetical protein